MNDLPGALLEETFIPEDVVAIKQDDGSVHLLMYIGKTETGGYLNLKYAVIPAEHAGVFAEPSEPLQPSLEAAEAFTAPPPPLHDERPVGPPPPDFLREEYAAEHVSIDHVGQADISQQQRPSGPVPRTRFSDMHAPGLDEEPKPVPGNRAPILDPDLLVQY